MRTKRKQPVTNKITLRSPPTTPPKETNAASMRLLESLLRDVVALKKELSDTKEQLKTTQRELSLRPIVNGKNKWVKLAGHDYRNRDLWGVKCEFLPKVKDVIWVTRQDGTFSAEVVESIHSIPERIVTINKNGIASLDTTGGYARVLTDTGWKNAFTGRPIYPTTVNDPNRKTYP